MAAPVLTLRRLNRATLARQMLLEREAVSVVEAAERLGGLQAQEPRPPFVGLWTRIERFEAGALAEALRAGDLVRCTLLRGTLHVVSARDQAALRPVLAPVLEAAPRILGDRAAGLDVDAVLREARERLADGPRTFKELRAELATAFPDVDDRAMGFTVRMHVPLVMVPTEDRWAFPRVAQFALAREDPGAAPASQEDGLQALVLRHLAAFGPATAADVQTWAGVQGLAPVLDRLRPRLEAFRDEAGRELLDLPDAPRPPEDVPAPVRFLPEFDNLVLSHKDRTRVIADEHRPALVTKNLRVKATFLLDGFAAGTWTSDRRRDTATLRLAPFGGRLPRGALSALRDEGDRLLRFLEPDAGTRDVVVEPASP